MNIWPPTHKNLDAPVSPPGEAPNYDPQRAPEALDDLFRRSAEQIAAGAQLIAWPEDSFFIRSADEAALLARAQAFSRQHQAWLALAYGSYPAGSQRYENKQVLIAPTGAVAWQYLKNHPVPGGEQGRVVRGNGGIPFHAGAQGRFAGAICYDADFPRFLRRAGSERAELLLLPSDDWRAIDPLHARMAVFRAIEQGVALLRPTLNGLSVATNARGEVLAAMDQFEVPDRVMIANLPLRHLDTLYSRFGDWFGWSCLAGLAALAIRARKTSS